VTSRIARLLAGALLLATLLAACDTQDAAAVRAAPRITDTSFETAAETACLGAVRLFDTGTTLPNQPSKEQSAEFLESIDATFADLVRQLHQITVARADQSAVTGWLADWDAYVAFGHTSERTLSLRARCGAGFGPSRPPTTCPRAASPEDGLASRQDRPFVSGCPSRSGLDFTPALQGAAEGELVGVLEIATYR
jgi:hypothetical protein